MYWRPHQLSPGKQTARVILAVKNFAAHKGVCHIGLGVTATCTAKTLRNAGYFCETWSAQTTAQLEKLLQEAHAQNDRNPSPTVPISHVIVSAPSWVQPDDFKSLCLNYPNIEFVQLNHSGCAFLSIDKFGIRNIRQACELELSIHNFRVAANNPRVAGWINRGLGSPCLLLPNLYDVDSFVTPYPHRPVGGTLKIGSFGAGRPWKNQLTAAEGAVQLARQMGVGLELYVNSKRPDGGERMIESRLELFNGLKGAKILDVPWEPWAQFRKTVSTMNLLLQPSFDETFNVVTADGIAEGVPSVTSSAIEWTPRQWWCETEDPNDVAKVGFYLLNDTTAVDEGRRALTDYVKAGLQRWAEYLGQ